jgi:hypothetical protein
MARPQCVEVALDIFLELRWVGRWRWRLKHHCYCSFFIKKFLSLPTLVGVVFVGESGGGGWKFLLVVVSRVMAMANAVVFFVCGRVWGWFKTHGVCSLSTIYEIFSKSNDGIGLQMPLPSPSLFFGFFFFSLSLLSLCRKILHNNG